MHFRLFIAALACAGLPILAAAQGPQINMPSFASLQEKATESVDITIGSLALGIMGRLMDDHDADSAETKKLLKGLKAIQVRSYQFAADFAYPTADLDAVQSQLSGPAWTQLVRSHDQKNNEDVDVYIALDGRNVAGFTIISSEPREFTIVNIVGTLDLEQVTDLQRELGLSDAAVARIPHHLL